MFLAILTGSEIAIAKGLVPSACLGFVFPMKFLNFHPALAHSRTECYERHLQRPSGLITLSLMFNTVSPALVE
jgi:hypothetical protein